MDEKDALKKEVQKEKFSTLLLKEDIYSERIISMSKKGMKEIGEACALIAYTEGLTAHEKSVRIRLKSF